jgi:hypothetical protein
VLAKSNSRCRFEGCPILRSVVDCIGDIGQLNVNISSKPKNKHNMPPAKERGHYRFELHNVPTEWYIILHDIFIKKFEHRQPKSGKSAAACKDERLAAGVPAPAVQAGQSNYLPYPAATMFA